MILDFSLCMWSSFWGQLQCLRTSRIGMTLRDLLSGAHNGSGLCGAKPTHNPEQILSQNLSAQIGLMDHCRDQVRRKARKPSIVEPTKIVLQLSSSSKCNFLDTSALRRKWYPSSTRGARPDKIRQSCEAEVNLMPGPKPVTIQLSAEERQAVEKLVRRHSAPQQIALRGRIVLAADDGHNNSQIARELSTSLKTVRRWRRRWLVLQPIALEDLSVEERLEDLARPGAPPRITADQRCRIESMACEEPEDSGRPISHRTSREIADEIMKRGIVRQISPRHAARLLKR